MCDKVCLTAFSPVTGNNHRTVYPHYNLPRYNTDSVVSRSIMAHEIVSATG